MAPRSRQHSIRCNPHAAVTIADLPSSVLVHCLGFLTLEQRLEAALACRRFAAAACDPELLREVDAGQLDGLWALRSLAAWLVRHGRHVRRLSLACYAEEHLPADCAAALASCLVAAGAAGRLEQVKVSGRVGSTEWVAALLSLQHLSVRDTAGEQLRVSPALSGLTALRSLALGGYPVSLAARASVPAGITWLDLLGDGSTEMPPQVTQLEQLARLTLEYWVHPPGSLAQLSHLSSSLTRLDVTGGRLPPVASTLTQLRHLHVSSCKLGVEEAGTMDAVLRQLQQLTCLVLQGRFLEPPAALAGLASLQRCYLQRTDQRAADEGAMPPLPLGPWLRSLRWLGAGIETLALSIAALQAATALEFVEVGDAERSFPLKVNWLEPGPTAFCAWLGQHPSLQKVSFLTNSDRLGGSPAFDSNSFAARLAQLCHRRPGLQVRCVAGAGDFRQPMWDLLAGDWLAERLAE